MPVGACQAEFAAAAAEDGLVLAEEPRLPWLCEQGHFGLDREEQSSVVDSRRLNVALGALERILEALDGKPEQLAAGRSTPLRGDFIHERTGALVEVDEHQHFTSFRLATLDLYPREVPLGFECERYRELCVEWCGKADGFWRTKPARAFGPGGRQRQRAYYDSLRDLGSWAMKCPPLLRVDAAHGDGRRAYEQHRVRLHAALGN
jgi:hypothetical protein